MDKRTILYGGQKVITKDGVVATIAFVSRYGIPYVYGARGFPVPVAICGDALGGEHDQEIGLAA